MDSCVHGIESVFEEKVDLEDLILPTKQVQKVDEKLTIEFSDIKQEPISFFENNMKCVQANNVSYSKCVSCDVSCTSYGQLTTIHSTCYRKLLDKLIMATEKNQEMEMKNNELQSNVNNLQSTIVGIKNEHKTAFL